MLVIMKVNKWNIILDNRIVSTIKYAQVTNEDIHSLDWLFLISQSIYWLKTLDTTGKTNASGLIIDNCNYSWIDTLRKAVEIRKSPILAKLDKNKEWIRSLGPIIQSACDTLCAERSDFIARKINDIKITAE